MASFHQATFLLLVFALFQVIQRHTFCMVPKLNYCILSEPLPNVTLTMLYCPLISATTIGVNKTSQSFWHLNALYQYNSYVINNEINKTVDHCPVLKLYIELERLVGIIAQPKDSSLKSKARHSAWQCIRPSITLAASSGHTCAGGRGHPVPTTNSMRNYYYYY